MSDIKFKIIQQDDLESIQLIADWYLSEWNIPIEKTVQQLQLVAAGQTQFQVLMTVDGTPVATGGIYDHVGLLDREPRFKIYKHWLALVYTIPNKRQQGFGTLLCTYIEEHAKSIGLEKVHLFTDTAERLYERLGWNVLERITLANRNIVIMEKEV